MKQPVNSRRHTRAVILLLALALVLSACSPEAFLEPLNWSMSDAGIARTADLPFGDEQRQRLDIYAPAQARGAPVILFWHGGSWKSGDKDQYRFVGSSLAEQGFVAVVPNYRLAPADPFPTFVQDAALAVRWVSDHARDFGGDPAGIFLSGHSAGGHIALILAFDDRYLRMVGSSPDRLAGIVSIAGPTGLENLRGESLKGVFPASVPDRDFSPIALAPRSAKSAPPVLLISGTDDDVVYASSAARLADAIRAGGGRATVKAYPQTGHLGLLLAFSDIFASDSIIAHDIAAFAGLEPAPQP